MSHFRAPPPHRCEAVTQTNLSTEQLLNDNFRCTGIATETIDGRHLCWLHAAAVRNPDRPGPVIFFEELDDVQR